MAAGGCLQLCRKPDSVLSRIPEGQDKFGTYVIRRESYSNSYFSDMTDFVELAPAMRKSFMSFISINQFSWR